MARVLIIESDAAVARSLTQMLAAKGAQTQVTADGNEGVNLARSFKPDLIVLCVELSRVSGYSICNKLKKDPDLGRIPLVLTSSQATEETFEQHKKLKTRAEAYLKKPYGEAEIMAIVGPWLGGRRGPARAEADVGLDELSVDVDELGIEPAARPAARAPVPARTATAVPGRPATSGGSDAEQLRKENRELRQKLQKLEQTVEQKELELNDHLVEESSRGREGLEVKKKLGALERDAARYKELAEKARAELAEVRREAEDARLSAQSGDSEKQMLSTKIGQLVDKVKSLAAERDALQQEVERLTEEKTSVSEDAESAARVREKARKAVDIAMQLIDETGLVQ